MTSYINDAQARDYECLALTDTAAARHLFGSWSPRRHIRRQASIDSARARALSRPANSVHAWIRAGQL